MSSVVKNLSDTTEFFRLHVKGSPEKIYELCLPSSIPLNFREVKHLIVLLLFKNFVGA